MVLTILIWVIDRALGALRQKQKGPTKESILTLIKLKAVLYRTLFRNFICHELMMSVASTRRGAGERFMPDQPTVTQRSPSE